MMQKPTPQQTPPQGQKKSTKEGQEVFDQLLARASQMIHSEKAADGLVEAVLQGDPVNGLAVASEQVINKIRAEVKKNGKTIPVSMGPDLTLEMIGQIAEMVNATGQAEITDEMILEAFKQNISSYMQKGMKEGRFKPEQVQSLANSGQRQGPPQQAPQKQPQQAPQQRGLLA